MECPTTINSTVSIDARVTVTPDVEVGDIETCYVGKPHIDKCRLNAEQNSYMVNQMLCIRYPLTFSTSASAATTGASCGALDHQTCEEEEICSNSHRNSNRRGNINCRRFLCCLLTVFCGVKILC